MLLLISICSYSKDEQLPNVFSFRMNQDLKLLEEHYKCKNFYQKDLKKQETHLLKAVYMDEKGELTSFDINIHFFKDSRRSNTDYGYSFCWNREEPFSDVLFFIARDTDLPKIRSGILLENSYARNKDDKDRLVYEVNGKKYSFHRVYDIEKKSGKLHFELTPDVTIELITCDLPSEIYGDFPGCNSKKSLEKIIWIGDLENDGYPEIVIEQSRYNSSRRYFISAKWKAGF